MTANTAPLWDLSHAVSGAHPVRHAVIAPKLALIDRIVERQAVIVDDGRIIEIIDADRVSASLPVRVLQRGILAPGFVDIHAHGAHGLGVNEGDQAAVVEISRIMLSAGVTTWLPTFASAPIPDLAKGLAVLRDVPKRPDTARIPGAHLEGPYFAQAQRGAQSAADLRTPDDDSVVGLLEYADVIAMMSFAPELQGALALTTRLVEAGIVAAAGHSDGDAAHLRAAQEAGLSHVIHIYSGQSSTRREGAWRVAGMLEATLASDDLTVEMIADGKHLPVEHMRIAHRALAGRLCLVSDASPGAGLPDGSEYGMGAVQYIVEDGVGMTHDRTSFGGSTTLLPSMLPIAQASLGLSTPDAIAMVTDIPARAARLSHVGRLEHGYLADFTVLSEQLEVADVATGGHWVSETLH